MALPIDEKEFSILMHSLHCAFDRLSDGRHDNPHCVSYGMVIVATSGESHYVLFNPKNYGQFRIEPFENKNNFETGHMVYFYDDKAEAIVQSTLRGDDEYTEIE